MGDLAGSGDLAGGSLAVSAGGGRSDLTGDLVREIGAGGLLAGTDAG